MKMQLQITKQVPSGYQIPVDLLPLIQPENGSWTNESLDNLEERMHDIVKRLYNKHLMLDPKARKLLVVRKCTWPSVFEAMIRRAAQNLNVPSVDFIDSHVLALLAAGKTGGLVVDCGWSETTVVPVFDSRPLKATTGPVGSISVCIELQTLLGTSHKLAELDDLKTRICYVEAPNTKETNQRWTMDGKDIAHDIRWKATEPLFTSDDLETVTVPQAIANCLLELPLDLRKPMSSAIHFVGGTCMLPGFSARVLEELDVLFAQPRYACLSKLPVAVVSSPFASHISPWVGGSLAAVLQRESIPSEFDQ